MKRFITFLLAMLAMVMAVAQTTPKRMAVATFDVAGNAVTKEEAEAVTELYISELVSTGKVSVVDRANFDKLLKEMKFQTSDWSDKEKTAKLGQAANAEVIARGQILRLGNKLYLSATAVDVKTAVILSSSRKPFSNIDEIFNLLAPLAQEVAKVFRTNYKIGDTGPGGGTIFYVDDEKCLECSKKLGSGTFDDAVKICKSYECNGLRDWYLPSINELSYIYLNLRRVEKISDNDIFWSSSSYTNLWVGYCAYTCNFSNGGNTSSHEDEETKKIYSVIAVRSFE